MDTTILVKRVEDEYNDEFVAILRIFKEDGETKIEVRAKNHLIKDHLTQVLESPFYQVSPMNYLSEGISATYSLFIQPKKKLYFMYLMDRLGWYGYIISPIKTTKSVNVSGFNSLSTVVINFDGPTDEEITQVVKSMGGGGGGCNISGENARIAKDNSVIIVKVPSGCIAVSSDGRVVGPGKFLNAKVGTPDSNWYLVPAPDQYQKLQQEETEIDSGIQEQERMASGEVTTEDENKERLQKELEEQKQKAEKRKKARREAVRRLLAAKLKLGQSEYAPAYYLLSGEEKQEEVSLETGETYSVSYVEVPKEALGEFKRHLDEIKANAKIITVAPKGEFQLEEVNDKQIIAFNNQAKVIAMPNAVPDLLKKYRTGWRIVFPPEGKRDITDEQVMLEYEEALKKLKKGQDPKIDAWTFLRGGLLKYARQKNKDPLDTHIKLPKNYASVRQLLEKAKVEYPDYKDSAELNVAKEFIARVVADTMSETVDNSRFTPLAPVEDDYKTTLKDKNPETIKKYEEFIGRVANLRSTFIHRKGDRFVFKASVPEVQEDFAQMLEEAGGKKIGLKWNPSIQLNNPARGGPYQLYLVKLAGNPKNYYNHPEGNPAFNGFDFNIEMGMGKTITAIATDAYLRAQNREAYTTTINGKKYEKFSVVFAPNPHTWLEELNKTLSVSEKDGDVLVISGDREDRQRKFEELLSKIKTGTGKLPKYIVIGTGKLRNDLIEGVLEDVDDFRITDDSIDLKYLQMLASGFVDEDGTKVDKGMIASLIVDEAGMFVNPKSNRTKLLRKLTKAITGKQNRGLVFTLNGELQSNSVMDFVYRMSYVNRDVMDNEKLIETFYTERGPHGKPQLRGVDAAAKIKRWESEGISGLGDPRKMVREARESLKAVMLNTEQIRMKDIEEAGKVFEDKEHVEQTGNFAAAQSEAYKKLINLAGLSKAARSNKEIKEIVKTYQVGILSLLINSSLGAGHPRSMIEYGIADNRLLNDYNKKLASEYQKLGFGSYDEALQDFQERLDEYKSLVLNDNMTVLQALGQVPKPSNHAIEKDGKILYMTTSNRQKLWEEIMGPHAQKLEEVVYSWKDPASSKVAETIKARIKSKPNRAVNTLDNKFVVAAPSRVAMKKLERILKSELPEHVAVQLIDGETPQDKREQIEKTHRETKQPVVTIVTNAGARGLNLQARNMIRYPFWSIGQARQAEGRARRNPKENLNLKVVVPAGGGQFMEDVLTGKLLSENVMQEPSDDVIEDFLEYIIEKEEKFGDAATLVAKLREYMKNVRPEVD